MRLAVYLVALLAMHSSLSAQEAAPKQEQPVKGFEVDLSRLPTDVPAIQRYKLHVRIKAGKNSFDRYFDTEVRGSLGGITLAVTDLMDQNKIPSTDLGNGKLQLTVFNGVPIDSVEMVVQGVPAKHNPTVRRLPAESPKTEK